MKRAERGFEEILTHQAPYERPEWEGQREVMRCITKLEDKAIESYKDRVERFRGKFQP